MLVVLATVAIILTAVGNAGAGSSLGVSGTDQVTSTPAPTTGQSAPGPTVRYVSEPADNPGDQAYCNLQADRANAMAGNDPTSAKWVVESANANGCKIVAS
ncbi:hypothetical protein [Rhodococcus daqingensis]|uniref:Excalibur calcium-binding domain-containing protein n=1 Tax=Rhodococcus daqingensis TaxID=2479363 RepID=A0ABW2RXA5_9NOCA